MIKTIILIICLANLGQAQETQSDSTTIEDGLLDAKKNYFETEDKQYGFPQKETLQVNPLTSHELAIATDSGTHDGYSSIGRGEIRKRIFDYIVFGITDLTNLDFCEASQLMNSPRSPLAVATQLKYEIMNFKYQITDNGRKGSFKINIAEIAQLKFHVNRVAYGVANPGKFLPTNSQEVEEMYSVEQARSIFNQKPSEHGHWLGTLDLIESESERIAVYQARVDRASEVIQQIRTSQCH